MREEGRGALSTDPGAGDTQRTGRRSLWELLGAWLIIGVMMVAAATNTAGWSVMRMRLAVLLLTALVASFLGALLWSSARVARMNKLRRAALVATATVLMGAPMAVYFNWLLRR
jgi:FtsH-binding integral membrane protein